MQRHCKYRQTRHTRPELSRRQNCSQTLQTATTNVSQFYDNATSFHSQPRCNYVLPNPADTTLAMVHVMKYAAVAVGIPAIFCRPMCLRTPPSTLDFSNITSQYRPTPPLLRSWSSPLHLSTFFSRPHLLAIVLTYLDVIPYNVSCDESWIWTLPIAEQFLWATFGLYHVVFAYNFVYVITWKQFSCELRQSLSCAAVLLLHHLLIGLTNLLLLLSEPRDTPELSLMSNNSFSVLMRPDSFSKIGRLQRTLPFHTK